MTYSRQLTLKGMEEMGLKGTEKCSLICRMILRHQKIDLWERTLIEKVSIKPPHRLTVNFSDEACFIHYKKGRTLINSPTEQMVIGSDESVILNCGTYFANLLEYPDGDSYEILVFHLHPDILKRLYRQEFPAFLKKEPGDAYMQKVESREIVQNFIENVYFYFENLTLLNDDILELKVKELILILMQTKNSHSIRDLLASLFTPLEVNIREVVHRHLYSNLLIKDLAELSNMTLASFNRKFIELFQDTPANYIRGRRLERAKELLRVSTLSIREIAFQIGFNDVPHFSRAFKQQFDMTPASFRTACKGHRIS
jgi:AraC-like DNA-binding protein